MKAAARRVVEKEWWAATERVATTGLLRELKRRGVCALVYDVISGPERGRCARRCECADLGAARRHVPGVTGGPGA